MSKSSYDQLVRGLESCGGNCSCNEIKRLLASVGFAIREGSGPGHRVFSHPEIKSFAGGNYNCGHGKNPIVTKIYVQNILKAVRNIEDELRKFLGETSV